MIRWLVGIGLCAFVIIVVTMFLLFLSAMKTTPGIAY